MQPSHEPFTQLRSKIEKPKSRDPVCGKEVDSGQSAGSNGTFDGETYDFCSEECRERFEANPSAYVQKH